VAILKPRDYERLVGWLLASLPLPVVGQSGIRLFHSFFGILVAIFSPDASWPTNQGEHTA
jgi:hypothetical protein